MEKRIKIIQVRISENEREMINEIYEETENFNLSNFIRDSIHKLYKEKVKNPNKGIGFFQIG